VKLDPHAAKPVPGGGSTPLTRAAPAPLSKRGLTTISDNLPPGKEVDFARDFALVFREEIAARFFRQPGDGAVPAIGAPLCPTPHSSASGSK
jgi:hypothetical protein